MRYEAGAHLSLRSDCLAGWLGPHLYCGLRFTSDSSHIPHHGTDNSYRTPPMTVILAQSLPTPTLLNGNLLSQGGYNHLCRIKLVCNHVYSIAAHDLDVVRHSSQRCSRCTLLFVCSSEVTTSVRMVGCNVLASSCDRDRQCSSGMHMR